MSRGLQMLVEEGSIPHALMLCGASGAEKSRFFIEKRKKLPVVGRRKSKNSKNCPSSADESQKTTKIARRRPTKVKKTAKTVRRRPTKVRKR